MADKQKPNQASDGEVVYRRVLPPTAGAKKERRFDPTLAPLVAGFALLLLLIWVLGSLSVRRLEDTSRAALELEHTHAMRAGLLLQLRVSVTKLDIEARQRMEANARREFSPPFDLRLDSARVEVADLLAQLDHLPLAELPKWRKFRDDLADYIEVTKDKARYSQEGFVKFRDVGAELNELVEDSAKEEPQIFVQADAMQNAATRSIRTWNLFALLAGLGVAVATIWQVQRRFLQAKQSTEAARREREFSNQMLEGMVSAIAATYRGRWNLSDDGAERTFDVYSSPLEIDGEHGQILTLVNVTEAAKAEAALRRGEALAAVGEAAAQLAHEIKNPLGSIRLGIEMLREYMVTADALKTMGLVERGIRHLNKLVVDVTQFSRRRHLDIADFD